MSGIQARFRITHGPFQLDVEFSAPGQGVTGLFGPSGSGKTTLLRFIAGLERERGGTLRVNGDVWQDDARGFSLPPHKRAVGYVFQEASLFPHLSVRGNLEYGYKRVPPVERRLDFDTVTRLLGLPALLDRAPLTLSGGERQRVAIGRALLTSPRLLLMDEPLANLDLASKREILPYLEKLHGELSLPVIYVSHQPEEMARLADHLLIMHDGRIVESGPAAALSHRLRGDLETVANGSQAGTDANLDTVVEATIEGYDSPFHLVRLSFAGGTLLVPGVPLPPGQPVRVRLGARDITLSREARPGDSALNIQPVTVRAVTPAGLGEMRVQLDCGGVALWCIVPAKSAAQLALGPGSSLFAWINRVTLAT